MNGGRGEDFLIAAPQGSSAVGSRPAAFEVAASIAFCTAAEAADLRLREPIMKVEVPALEEFFGEEPADLRRCRGGVEERGR